MIQTLLGTASVTPFPGIYQAARGEGTVASTQKMGGITLCFPQAVGAGGIQPAGSRDVSLSAKAWSRAISVVLWALAEYFVEPTMLC